MEISKTIDKRLTVAIVAALVLLAVAWRLAPHSPNFAPIGAVALTLGAALGWRSSLLIMAIIMGATDIALGTYSSMQWTWLGVGLIVGLGHLAKSLPLSWRIPVGAFGASCLFFIVSNFGTWIASGMYTLDLPGLMQCYVAALPFLRATMLSDIVFTAALLSTYEMITATQAERRSVVTIAA